MRGFFGPSEAAPRPAGPDGNALPALSQSAHSLWGPLGARFQLPKPLGTSGNSFSVSGSFLEPPGVDFQLPRASGSLREPPSLPRAAGALKTLSQIARNVVLCADNAQKPRHLRERDERDASLLLHGPEGALGALHL